MYRPRFLFLRQTWVCLILIIVSSLLFGCTWEEPVSVPLSDGEEFQYRKKTYVMDGYTKLFDGHQLGKVRQALFEDYLKYSKEGQARRRACISGDAKEVWSTLTREEQTTFLAITGALATLKTDDGSNILHWIAALKEIHGERAFLGDKKFKNNEAFRLYATLTPKAIQHLEDAKKDFASSCIKKRIDYDGAGSRHPDYCESKKFDAERKTDNCPNLQFNYSCNSRCADIDIDYRRGFLHLFRNNSNILAGKQVLKFNKQYCDPGFRLKP